MILHNHIVENILSAETGHFGDICLSVCLSVIPFVYSKLERRGKFIFYAYFTNIKFIFTRVNGKVYLRSKRQRSRSLRTKCKNYFCACFHESVITYIKSTPI